MSRRFRLFSIQLTAFVWLLSILCFIPTLQAQSAGDFTVVVLPDTQYYSQSYPQIFDSQTQWIASNAAAQNIKLVIGEGDIVNVSSNYPSGSNENFYETFTWGGKNYLILVLEFVPRGGAVAWAKSVLSSNSDKEVIVVTHSYLYSDGTTVDQGDTSDMVGDNNGAMLWSNLISQYPNISVVLNGHITNKFSARRSDIGVNGNFVHQIFANWQDWTNGGNGYLRIMRFSPSNNSIQVQSFSPYTGLFLTDAANQFTLKWHNDGAAGSGTAVVTGRVRTSGYGLGCSAISGATVNVGGTTATADANGYYSVSVSPGHLSATAATSGYQTATQTATLNDHFPNQLDFFLTPVPPCAQSSTDPSVTVCTPKNGSTVLSPMNVVAGTNSSSPIVALSVWLDGSKVFSTGQSLLNTSVTAVPGNHLLAVQGQNGAKQTFTQTINVTAVNCWLLTAVPSENICSPVNNSSVASLFSVQAAARTANPVKYSQIWLDGVLQYQVAGAFISTSINSGSGVHRLTVQTADVTNIITKQTIYVTVPSTSPSCTPGATDPSVTICAPAANATVKSPVTITAATKDSASAVTNMFIWVDGVKQWSGTGSSVNTSLALATGAHRVTVQAKDAAAHYFQSNVNINVQ